MVLVVGSAMIMILFEYLPACQPSRPARWRKACGRERIGQLEA